MATYCGEKSQETEKEMSKTNFYRILWKYCPFFVTHTKILEISGQSKISVKTKPKKGNCVISTNKTKKCQST